MQFEKIKVPRIADTIIEQMERLILNGTLKPGEKLPVERELSEQFNVSRASLREAIAILEARGLISSRRGEGTFVRDVMAPSLTEPLKELMERHRGSVYDIVELRHGLEAVAAYYAALRGTDADREVIRLRFAALQQAHALRDSALEAKADAEFHLAIAEAAHNVFLLHVLRALFGLLHKSIVNSLETLYTREHSRREIPKQHAALLEAILAGDPEGARTAAHEHLAFVEETMLDLSRERSRKERSLRRLKGLTD